MSLVRSVARPMLASVFVAGGMDALRHPASRVPAATRFLDRVGGPLGLPPDPELLVRANALTMVGAGTLLARGHVPRLAAAALAGALVPTTLAGHAYWQERDPDRRAQQRTQFLKNLALLGGLLLATVDTEGRPSHAWRAEARAKHIRAAALRAARTQRATNDAPI
jgi:putative oxidoreductase